MAFTLGDRDLWGEIFTPCPGCPATHYVTEPVTFLLPFLKCWGHRPAPGRMVHVLGVELKASSCQASTLLSVSVERLLSKMSWDFYLVFREPQGIIACCNPVPPLVRQQINEMHLLIQQAREMPLLKVCSVWFSSPFSSTFSCGLPEPWAVLLSQITLRSNEGLEVQGVSWKLWSVLC